MRFEVYVPRIGKKDVWLRLLLEADTWINALKSGLLKLGEDGQAVDSAVCEVMPNGSFVVRDPRHNRTFLLRECGAVPDGSPPAAAPPRARPAPEEVGDARQAELSLVPSSPGMALPGRVVEEAEASPPQLPAARAARPLAAGPLDQRLPEVQRAVDGVSRFGRDLQGAAGHVLDLAMGWVPCESGSVLFTHVNREDLYFAAARGPKAKEVLAFRVPIGKGIVGFCAAEGTCLAVIDVKSDPRFFSRISESLGHEVHTIMAAPILSRGRVYGAIELLNRQDGTSFSEEELRLLSFIGYRFAEYLLTVIPG